MATRHSMAVDQRVAETVWNWVVGKVDAFLTWVRDVAAPWIEGAVSTAWTWTVGVVDGFLPGLRMWRLRGLTAR